MRPFQQCITVTAVNLFYEVLPKQFEAFGFYFSQGKKQVTAEYCVSLGSKGFCHQKCYFSFVKKVQISSNIFPKIPNFASLQCIILVYSLVKFRQKSIFSSRRPVFVISSVFREKRNPLEPIVINHPRYLLICDAQFNNSAASLWAGAAREPDRRGLTGAGFTMRRRTAVDWTVMECSGRVIVVIIIKQFDWRQCRYGDWHRPRAVSRYHHHIIIWSSLPRVWRYSQLQSQTTAGTAYLPSSPTPFSTPSLFYHLASYFPFSLLSPPAGLLTSARESEGQRCKLHQPAQQKKRRRFRIDS